MTTLIVSPNFSFDPINLPKMLVLVVMASILLVSLASRPQLLWRSIPSLVSSSLLFCASLVVSVLSNPVSYYQQIFGIWGRATGLLTYFSFTVILLAAATLYSKETTTLTRVYFERLSYFVTAYTILQAADLDPINWSQKLMIATLGNINFMSSFLGLATISMVSRVVIEKLTFSSFSHYLTVSSINVWLILYSGSIQGLAVIAAGVVILIAFEIRSKGSFMGSIAFLGMSIIGGACFLSGTMGFGPLSALKQETVEFRIDYWAAGLRMTWDNLLNGVGIDSYGDYYRQYRDLTAVTRTGPQRVTNTAHNIFLDVSTGSGLISVGFFLAIFLLCFITLLSGLRTSTFDPNEIAISAIFVGFFVFCLISINQIGVGVWGFLFMGLLLGKRSRDSLKVFVAPINRASKIDLGKKIAIGRQEEPVSLRILVPTLFIALAMFAVAALPNAIDIRALEATRKRDFVNLGQIASSNFSASFYRDKYLALLIDSGRDSDALIFAMSEVKRNPRSEFSWRIIAYSESAPKEDRLNAIGALRSLDPFNEVLLEELENIESKLAN